MDVREKFQKAIEESLPGMVGKELQSVLQDYEETKSDLAYEQKRHEALKKQYEKTFAELRALRDLEYSQERVDKDREEVEKKERDIEVIILRNRFASMEQSKNDIYRLTEKVFGNKTMSYSTSKNFNKHIPGEHGGYGFDVQESEIVETTVTES